jgi:hypothetical protein
MNSEDFNRQRLEELLLTSVNRAFSEAERVELNALLRDNAAARNFAARSLNFDAILVDCLMADESRRAQFQPISQSPITIDFKRRNWLAKAAVWIGAFHLFGNTAKAGSTIATSSSTTVFSKFTIVLLMKKTIVSITSAILVLGGSGIYAIHNNNESSRARVDIMEREIQALSDQLGIQSSRSTSRLTGGTASQKPVSIVQLLAIFNGDNRIDLHERAILENFKKQLSEMDTDSMKNLLLDAEKISNPIHGRVVEMIMCELIKKDPAEATQIAGQLIGRGSEFQFQLSHAAADAFVSWLAKDPAAADAWYVVTAAAGSLGGTSIAPNGLEDLVIDRSFARLRFSAQVKANPTEAASMLATMLPADVTMALKTVTDPNALRQILPKLSPEQKSPAAEGAITAMAASDLSAAFAWAKSLEMDEPARNALMATGIEAAVKNGKLDLAGVVETSKSLSLDDGRRSGMLVSSAASVTMIPRENENVIDVENSVVWDRVPERIDWLRKEVSSEYAGKAVGDYLGKLLSHSHNLDKATEAYEREIARQGAVDPNLAIAFVRHLGWVQPNGYAPKALKYLNQLPPSSERDHSIELIEMNR